MNNNIKERLIKYAKDKHIDIREETIEKMINFANNQNMVKIPIKCCNQILYMDEDEWKAINAFRKEKEKNLKPLGLIL